MEHEGIEQMSARSKGTKRSRRDPIGWDPVADWYDGWVGKGGSKYHRELAIPSVVELLNPQPGERILDIGAGQGVLAPFVVDAHADYVGIDISSRLLQLAREYHGNIGEFILGDVCKLPELPEMHKGQFDGAVFLLSIQDMDPLDDIFRSVSWALRLWGRVVLLMTHPCFRIPRQSGWGWDENRKLRYRRIDRYLTPLPVPMKAYSGQASGVTTSFHRPLQEYVNTLADHGLLIDHMIEISTYKQHRSSEPRAKAKNLANREIPLFLGLRARKIE